MDQFFRNSVFILVVVCSSGIAGASEHLQVDPSNTRISFLGRSTLHAFNGNAQSVSGSLDSDHTAGGLQASGNIAVDVVNMDTGNPKRDRNMKVMLNQQQFPQILCRIDALRSEHLVNDKDEEALVKGVLTIAGREQPVEFKVRLYKSSNEWVVEGTHNISLSRYELHPPSVIGLIRVFDTVRVDFKVAFQKGSR